MRASRLVTATIMIAGIVIVGVNPGCSSSAKSAFNLDGGLDGDVGDATTAGDGSPDGRREHDGADDVSKMKLGAPDVKMEAAIVHEAGFNDAKLQVDASCLADAGPSGPGPAQHVCIIYPAGNDSDNECDGHHDPPAPYPSNGTTGNGFDDNCNGLVDEGCTCDAVGTTKPCYLVPAEQTVDGLPVGWCAENSKGTVACEPAGESGAVWSGLCRGAQPPFASDVCAPGDFNCDGKEENPTTGSCACNVAPVQCPTAAVTTAPFPNPDNLPLEINAAPWFTDPANVALATDWSWTLTGGDCDNILPHPTFAIYPTSNGVMLPTGTQNNTLGASAKEHGWVASGSQLMAVAGGAPSAIYPAFSLSGDYLVQASWMLNGQAYTCDVKVQVRAPGIRAEGCWSTEGQDDDLDLHMAKINGFDECTNAHTWSNTLCQSADEDCFYGDCYNSSSYDGSGGDTVEWGYASSPASACTGWGSQSTGNACGNPRLDRDANGLSGACGANIINPASGKFCGPENINVDYPEDNDRFAVGLRFYGRDGDATGPALSHVNVYCDGVRVLSAGYDPTMGSNFPGLLTPGGDSTGDMWKVAVVQAQVTGSGLTCLVTPTQSAHPDPLRDGSNAYCVDDSTLDGDYSQEFLTYGGEEPTDANALCFH